MVLTNSLINRNAKFKLAPVNNLIIGHSHSECAFNDSIINNFKNLSALGESYFYSYQKLKKVLPQNKKIKNVFIEFSNNQITKQMDYWTWDDKHLLSRSRYLPFIDIGDLKLLWSKNPSGFITSSSKSFRNNTMNVLMFRYNYKNKLGGYFWLNRFKTDSLVANLKKDNLKLSNKSDSISTKNIEYLQKIVSLCKTNKVNVFFIRSPQHPLLPTRKNEKQFLKIKSEMFKNITFLDFNNFPVTNNEFGDLGHLNYLGAKKFSLWFNTLLKKELLLKNNKEEFVIKEIDKLRDKNKDFNRY